MKANNMTLTTQDLSAIKGIVGTEIERAIDSKVPPMINVAIDRAIDNKVKPLIDDAIDDLSLKIGQGFNEVTERFDRVEGDIAVIKTNVSELKTDVSALKVDVAELKVDMREVKWGIDDTVRRAEFLDVRDRVTRLEQRH
jgi:polyhydroxyalkanoate synthesis regulator phasin